MSEQVIATETAVSPPGDTAGGRARRRLPPP
jgi:hypothetical protein